MIIGLTGCPGSGKSVLAAELVKNGWLLVDADDMGREVVEEDPAVLTGLIDAFGRDIVNSDGVLLRRVLGKRAFADPVKTRKLNDIVHPRLIRSLREKVRSLQHSGNNTVVDCALIFEWEIQSIFDVVICVAADEQLRTERIMLRDGRSAEDVENIFSAQLPEIEKIQKADIVIKNNGSIESLNIYGKLFSCLPDYRKGVTSG